MELNKIYNEDCLVGLKNLPDNSIDCCVTSPPYYGLRDYGNDKQIGLEETPELYVQKLVDIFREVKRVLKKEGTLWLNLGDTYYNFRGYSDYSTKQTISSNDAHVINSACGKRNSRLNGLKGKDLIGIPWMVAFALRADGWYLRQDIIWSKRNCMPESVTDRCTKAHEYIFLLAKSQKYYYDYEAILEEATGFDGRKDTRFKGLVKYKDSGQTFAERGHERWRYKNLQDKGQSNHTMHENRALGLMDEDSPIRNKRSVWDVTTKPYSEAHFATYPQELILPCILAGCPENGVVLDPFMGAGTTGLVAIKNNRNYIGFELNPEYIKIAEKRILEPVEIMELGYAKTKLNNEYPTLF